jgi:hypothetical protein
MKQHMEKRGFNMPVYQLASTVSEKFRSRKIPTSFLISPEGKIVMLKQGAADWDGRRVFELVDEMISKRKNRSVN